jgi:hypothetical protein
MLRGIARGIVLVALAALAGSCDSNTPVVTAPSIVTITETYSGTIIPASAGTFSFTTLSGGAITATLTAVGPDNTKTVGFSLGTFVTAANTCTVILDNSQAAQAFAFNAQASSIGVYCVRIYDNGNAATDKIPYTFTITVTHPQ